MTAREMIDMLSEHPDYEVRLVIWDQDCRYRHNDIILDVCDDGEKDIFEIQ